MKTIHTGICEVVFVEVPTEIIWAKIGTSNNIVNFYSEKGYSHNVTIEFDAMKVMVTPLDEYQCKEIVEQVGNSYMNYNAHPVNCDLLTRKSAVESFESLMQANGLDLDKKYAVIKIEK